MRIPSIALILFTTAFPSVCRSDGRWLTPTSNETLSTPESTDGNPGPGKRVAVTPQEFSGSSVYHTLYLPPDWKPDCPKRPVIFEYTGNYFPQSGSTGEVRDAGLGYGLSGGRFIWVSLPYINAAGDGNQVTWWGDEKATIAYANKYVPEIIKSYNADPNNVFLCGFSRGAIGVNYLGLHDDDIAELWTAFITHDHFDGVKQWGGTSWGSPLKKYREEAADRLKRVGDRPYLVSQNGSGTATLDYIESVLPNAANFKLSPINTTKVFGTFPNDVAKHPHTDRWLLKPSRYRETTWNWVNAVVARRQSQVDLGELIFEDRFERNESQEEKDEPGNEWTTSSGKTAGGNKQVDLRDGTMHVYTHATANHATSVRHEYKFRNGTIALRFVLHSKSDTLKMNFTDLGCKTVHAGHLFDVVLSPDAVTIEDRKTGVMDLAIRNARTNGTLTAAQKADLQTKKKTFPTRLAIGVWHEVYAHVDADRVFVELNNQPAAEFQSNGFTHETKTMIRLLVPGTATVDDVRIWRR